SQDVFKKYSNAYNIFRDVYQLGLTGLEIRNISNELAGVIQKIVLKEQEICYKAENTNKKFVNLFIPASLWNIKELTRRILTSGDEDLGYKIINVIKNYEEYFSKCYKIGNKEFSFDRSYVMGILNVTPDSFSDGGKYLKLENAINHGLEMIEEGADIIDIGGESTRPGAEKVSHEEEIKRIIPVIDGILKKNPEAIISVDTTKKMIAEKALQHGAKIINDISALTFDPELGEIIKKNNASIILMHMKGTPVDMQNDPFYEDVVREIYDFLYERIQLIQKLGIKNVFIDPGIGFGKRVEDNFELIRRLEDFKSLGYPILIGVSRKSFIGKTLNLVVTDRDTATALIESLAVKNGARIIRTHNVKYGVQVCKLLKHLA
ncbi:MAG: dihydropteroate synthase, partial [Bacteroidetes bacterium]|nr:dihydropteroate synthase [Bacteroidota bacterium]